MCSPSKTFECSITAYYIPPAWWLGADFLDMPRSVLLRRICLQMEAVRARICKSLWGPGIDSDDSIPPAYVVWRVGTTNRVVVPARQAGNRDSWAP